jgi:cytochrome c biogenesis protein CcmG/thiol:disulfide interchange protein DsbE
MKWMNWPRLVIMLVSVAVSANPQTTTRPAPSRDSPQDVQQVLSETARNYREAKSYRIERETFTLSRGESLRVWEKTFSKVASAPGNRYILEDKNDYRWTIRQSDGTTEWSWYPWRKQYVQQPLARISEGEASIPGEGGWVGWLRQIDKKLASGRVQPSETIHLNGRRVNCMVIIGPPPARRESDPTMLMQTTYWIDRDRKLLVKEEAVVRSTTPEHNFESRMTTTYTVAQFNTLLPDSLFKFVPAKNAERIAKFESSSVELAGKLAPPLKLKTLDGKDFDLASLRGKPVLLDFWATWCLPCRESMPMLAKLYEEMKGRGLILVSVSKDEDPAEAAQYITKRNYAWTNLADPKWESDIDWGGSGIPRLVLVGEDGKVVFESDGYDKGEEAKLRAALHKMDASF